MLHRRQMTLECKYFQLLNWNNQFFLAIEAPDFVVTPRPGPFQTLEKMMYVLPKCEVRGTPTPNIRWYKDGAVIDSRNNSLGFIIAETNMRYVRVINA